MITMRDDSKLDYLDGIQKFSGYCNVIDQK